MNTISDTELVVKLIEFIEDTAKILDNAVLESSNIQSLKGACSGVAEFVVKIEELDWVRFRKTGDRLNELHSH